MLPWNSLCGTTLNGNQTHAICSIQLLVDRVSMVTAMVKTQCVVFPEVSFLFSEVKDALSALRQHLKFLESTDVSVCHEAFMATLKHLDFLTRVVTPGARVEAHNGYINLTKESVFKFQSMLRSLGASEIPLAILRKPLIRLEDRARDCAEHTWRQMTVRLGMDC